MKSALLFIFVFLSAASARADVWDSRIQLARSMAAGGRKAEAVAAYRQIIQALPKEDPRVEELSAEVIYALYATKNYDQTIKASLAFLRAYTNSKYGFQVSYVLAAAEFGLQRHGDAFAIFSSFSFEQIRVLPADSRQKVTEVLIRSLSGMKQDAASQALRADATGFFNDAEGQPLLSGSVQSILIQVPGDTALEDLLLKVGSPANREAIRVVLGRPAADDLFEAQVVRFVGGLGLSLDSTNSPVTSQKMTQVQVGVDWRGTQAGSGGGARLEFDLLSMGNTPTGYVMRSIGLFSYARFALLGSRVGFQLFGSSGLILRTANATPLKYGYPDLIGLYAGLELRKGWKLGSSIGFRFLIAPYNVLFGVLIGSNYLVRYGGDFSFIGLFERENSVFIEGETIHFGRGNGQLMVSRLTLGYRVLF